MSNPKDGYQGSIFDLPEHLLFAVPESIPEKNPNTCKTCVNIQKWECGGSFFFYCGVRKSNRTDNGLLKVKCKTEACLQYKRE